MVKQQLVKSRSYNITAHFCSMCVHRTMLSSSWQMISFINAPLLTVLQYLKIPHMKFKLFLKKKTKKMEVNIPTKSLKEIIKNECHKTGSTSLRLKRKQLAKEKYLNTFQLQLHVCPSQWRNQNLQHQGVGKVLIFWFPMFK